MAVGTIQLPLDDDDEGRIAWDYYDASFWARRPAHVEGPSERTFVEVKRGATCNPSEPEAALGVRRLEVYWGDDSLPS